jgi:hypothetical protein
MAYRGAGGENHSDLTIRTDWQGVSTTNYVDKRIKTQPTRRVSH